MSEFTYVPWVVFRGYIVTCNEDGSIPLNSRVVVDMSMLYGPDSVTNQLNRVVAAHNELLAEWKKNR